MAQSHLSCASGKEGLLGGGSINREKPAGVSGLFFFKRHSKIAFSLENSVISA
jgi:hypothetical protein